MPYFEPEVVEKVKKIDLLTYLKNYEPYELVHFSGNTYSTKTHDSLKISNGKWMWWSRRIGGKSALDYLIKVRGIDFTEAMETIMGQAGIHIPTNRSVEEKKEKRLLLPERNSSPLNVFNYLRSRGLDTEIIQFCLDTGRIYESEPYHNAVFVGLDQYNLPRYAALRGVNTDFIGDANGSDKDYSFSIPAEETSDVLHLFESAIDLLSYATLLKINNQNWRKEHLLSLAGIYQPAKDITKSKIPAALKCYLNDHPEIKIIAFHLDNDKAGRDATLAIMTVLPNKYQSLDRPAPGAKDVNEYLCKKLGLQIVMRTKKGNKER